MKRNNKKFREYRRLRRKARRLKRQRAFFRFLLNRILPFALLRFLFKKNYLWVTLFISLLALL